MIDWAIAATDELEEIVRYLDAINPQIALATYNDILGKVFLLETHPMFGVRVPGLSVDYRSENAAKNKYKIYYKVQGEKFIKVLMIRHNSRQQPALKDLRKRNRE